MRRRDGDEEVGPRWVGAGVGDGQVGGCIDPECVLLVGVWRVKSQTHVKTGF